MTHNGTVEKQSWHRENAMTKKIWKSSCPYRFPRSWPHSRSLPLSPFLSLSLSHTHNLSLALSHTPSLSLSLSLTHTHAHTHTHTLLSTAGIDPNVGDYDLRTPLHVSVAEGLLLRESAPHTDQPRRRAPSASVRGLPAERVSCITRRAISRQRK